MAKQPSSGMSALSTLRFKLKNDREYKVVRFDGGYLGGRRLRDQVYESLRSDPSQVGLQIVHAETKAEVSDDDLVPANSTLVVHRIPLKGRRKAGPKTSSSSQAYRKLGSEKEAALPALDGGECSAIELGSQILPGVARALVAWVVSLG